MKALKEMSLAILLAIFLGTIFAAVVKYLNQGTKLTQGIVLSVNSSLFTDCFTISQTNQGETLTDSFCVYKFHKIKIPKVKDSISLKFNRSPYLFMNTIEWEKTISK